MFTREIMDVIIDVQEETSWVSREEVSKSTEIRDTF